MGKEVFSLNLGSMRYQEGWGWACILHNFGGIVEWCLGRMIELGLLCLHEGLLVVVSKIGPISETLQP